VGDLSRTSPYGPDWLYVAAGWVFALGEARYTTLGGWNNGYEIVQAVP